MRSLFSVPTALAGLVALAAARALSERPVVTREIDVLEYSEYSALFVQTGARDLQFCHMQELMCLPDRYPDPALEVLCSVWR